MSDQPTTFNGVRDTLVLDSLVLESGKTLEKVPVAYHTWGSLTPSGDNAVLICHALTGSSDVVDWWPGIVGPGNAIDTDRYFVVSANVLGSPYGSFSPVTVDPVTGRPYGPDFPFVTIRDTVAAHRRVLEHLGVRSVVAAVGASMGGMQALEWAFEDEVVRSIVPIAVGGRHSAWCIGWSDAQRQAIYSDPNWNAGRYDPDRPPAQGLATARMIAMISYRSQREFHERFGRDIMPPNGQAEVFAAESYLRYQGKKLVDRFDANCYVQLTRQMDTHDLARGRGDYESALAQIRQPAMVIGIDSDILYPLSEQEELARWLPNARLEVIKAPFGHDSFLIERDRMGNLLSNWLSLQAGSDAIRSPRDGSASDGRLTKQRNAANRAKSSRVRNRD